MKHVRIVSAALATIAIASPALAQIPEANASGFGMAGNYTAVARGFDAIAYNPANLALGHPEAFGFSLLAVGANAGINPVHLSDFKANQHVVVPASTRESWLQQIGSGREKGSTDAGVSFLALNIKNFGVQVGAVGVGEVNLNQDAAEALLFGNAGRTGSAKSFDFSGSDANGSLFGVGAVSYGVPVYSTHESKVAIGVTAKYIRGIAAGRAADHGSLTTPDNVNVQLPVIYTDSTHVGNAGSGIGVDLGLSYATERTTFSLAARNIMNTFKWATDAFTSRPDGFSFDGTNTVSSFDAASYANAPADMRSAFEEEKFKPEFAVGLAHETGALLLSADAGTRLGEGIELGPKTHVGVGAEYEALSVLTLRAGVAKITDGMQGAAGVGVHFGPYSMSVGVMTRSMHGRSETGAVFNLLSIH